MDLDLVQVFLAAVLCKEDRWVKVSCEFGSEPFIALEVDDGLEVIYGVAFIEPALDVPARHVDLWVEIGPGPGV